MLRKDHLNYFDVTLHDFFAISDSCRKRNDFQFPSKIKRNRSPISELRFPISDFRTAISDLRFPDCDFRLQFIPLSLYSELAFVHFIPPDF